MPLFTRLKWAAGILLIFLVVFITNLIDRDNFKQLNASAQTIYEDRIVASDLLFEMSTLIHQMHVSLLKNDLDYRNRLLESTKLELDNLIDRYSQTKLTRKEEVIFDNLKQEIALFHQTELATGDDRQVQALLASVDKTNEHLHKLSEIQLVESRRQLAISNKAKDTIDLFSQWEIIFLVIMAILIQVVLFYRPGKREST